MPPTSEGSSAFAAGFGRERRDAAPSRLRLLPFRAGGNLASRPTAIGVALVWASCRSSTKPCTCDPFRGSDLQEPRRNLGGGTDERIAVPRSSAAAVAIVAWPRVSA